MLEFSHITEIPEFQSLEKRAFEHVVEEHYQRFLIRLRQDLLDKQRRNHILNEMGEKAWKMLEEFINNSAGVENLEPIVEFDMEDESIQVDIPKQAISVYLYYNEDSEDEENFDEAYLYYEEGTRQIITNNTTINIAKFVSEILKNQ